MKYSKFSSGGACPQTPQDGSYLPHLFHPWPVFMPCLYLCVCVHVRACLCVSVCVYMLYLAVILTYLTCDVVCMCAFVSVYKWERRNEALTWLESGRVGLVLTGGNMWKSASMLYCHVRDQCYTTWVHSHCIAFDALCPPICLNCCRTSPDRTTKWILCFYLFF